MAQKSARKSETVKYVTPFGIARFPKLNIPDTEGRFADGKFKTTLLFVNNDDVAAFREAQNEAAKKLIPGVSLETLNLPLKEQTDKDRNTGEKTVIGRGITAKSKNRPLVMDAKRNKLPEGVKIGGGSEIRISGAFAPYEKASEETIIENGQRRKEKITERGLTFYLNAVQVRELKQGGGVSDGSEFEAVDGGFEYEGSNTDSALADATEL